MQIINHEIHNYSMEIAMKTVLCSIGQCTVLEFRIDPQLTVRFVFDIKH